MARSAYVLAHELGHVNAHDHHSEDQANAWAAAHLGQVLSALGLDRHVRREIVALARRRLLI
jgi:predicted Zn-dependent protease